MRSPIILAVLTGLILAACAGRPSAGAQQPSASTQPLPPTMPPPTAVPTPIAPSPDVLTTDQLNQRLDPFASPDCTLPCYNGLTPGHSDLAGALAFYARLGIGVSDFVPGDYQTALGGVGNLRATLMRASDIVSAVKSGYVPPQANVYLEGGQVQIVYLRWDSYPTYLAAPRILSALGAPDQISLAMVFDADPAAPTGFALEMVYTARQTGFVFVGIAGGDATSRQVCLSAQAVKAAVLGTFAPGRPPLADSPVKAKLLPLSDSTGVSPADFATAASASGCLSIPADKWSQWKP